jgi:hypothetical protein
MAGLDDRSYRRGLILGLTMAEVMILVLFALLLIWMVGLRDRKHETDALKNENDRLRAENNGLQLKAAELVELKNAIAANPNAPNNIDELFRELTIAKADAAQLQEQLKSRDLVAETMSALGYPLRDEKTASDAVREIRAKLNIASSVLKNAKVHSSKEGIDESEIVATLGSLAQIEAALSSRGKDMRSAAEDCANALTRETDCNTRLNTLNGRLMNAQQQLASSGRGTEKPACWADQTGKPEYIFDIALKSRSIVVRDNALPNRRTEEAALPIDKIAFGADVGQDEFRMQTRALFDWSEKEKCRFFVRVFDLTAVYEKDIYKRQLRTVGEHFYYYEDLSRPWEADRVTGIR